MTQSTQLSERHVRDGGGRSIFNEDALKQEGNLSEQVQEVLGKLNKLYPDFKFKLNAAKLTKFDQIADDISAQVIEAQNSSDEALKNALLYKGDVVDVSGTGSLIEQNGRPEWRATSSIGWRQGAWGAGLKYRYIGAITDTGLDYKIDDEAFEYKGENITVDLNNIKDKNLDESLVVEGKNEFSFTLPVSKKEITFKFLNHGDELAIAREVKGNKKIF